MSRKNKTYIVTALVLAFVAASIWIIGDAGLLAPDEYNYSNIYGTTQRIASLKDIKTSLAAFYTNWTGRILVHGIIQLFLWLNVNAFYIINAIIFVLFLIGIIRVFDGEISLTALVSVLICVIYGTVDFGEKYIWLAGSINYLWPSCMMVYLLHYFYRGICKQQIPNKYMTVFYWILAFLTGFSQENTVFITGSFILILVISKWKEIVKLSRKEILYWSIGIICFGIGAMLLIFAPGNFVRFHNSDGSGIQTRVYNIARNLFHIKWLILVYLLLFVLIYKEEKREKSFKVCKNQITYVIIPCIVAMLPMLIISEFYDRAMLPYEVLIIAGCIYTIKILVRRCDLKKKYYIPVIALVFIIAITPLMTNAYFSIKYLKPYKKQITIEAEQQIDEGKDTLILKQFEYEDDIPSGGIINKQFLFDSLDNDICNYYAARYYGVKALYCISSDECQIEFDTDIEVMGSVSVLDSNSRQVGKQIVNAKRPVVPMGNRLVLQIPKDIYFQANYQLPENMKGHITQIIYREYGKEENIDLNQLKIE